MEVQGGPLQGGQRMAVKPLPPLVLPPSTRPPVWGPSLLNHRSSPPQQGGATAYDSAVQQARGSHHEHQHQPIPQQIADPHHLHQGSGDLHHQQQQEEEEEDGLQQVSHQYFGAGADDRQPPHHDHHHLHLGSQGGGPVNTQQQQSAVDENCQLHQQHLQQPILSHDKQQDEAVLGQHFPYQPSDHAALDSIHHRELHQDAMHNQEHQHLQPALIESQGHPQQPMLGHHQQQDQAGLHQPQQQIEFDQPHQQAVVGQPQQHDQQPMPDHDQQQERAGLHQPQQQEQQQLLDQTQLHDERQEGLHEQGQQDDMYAFPPEMLARHNGTSEEASLEHHPPLPLLPSDSFPVSSALCVDRQMAPSQEGQGREEHCLGSALDGSDSDQQQQHVAGNMHVVHQQGHEQYVQHDLQHQPALQHTPGTAGDATLFGGGEEGHGLHQQPALEQHLHGDNSHQGHIHEHVHHMHTPFSAQQLADLGMDPHMHSHMHMLGHHGVDGADVGQSHMDHDGVSVPDSDALRLTKSGQPGKKRGRPKGSKNRPKPHYDPNDPNSIPPEPPVKRKRGRPLGSKTRRRKGVLIEPIEYPAVCKPLHFPQSQPSGAPQVAVSLGLQSPNLGDLSLATPSGHPFTHVDHVGMGHVAQNGETPAAGDPTGSGGGGRQEGQLLQPDGSSAILPFQGDPSTPADSTQGYSGKRRGRPPGSKNKQRNEEERRALEAKKAARSQYKKDAAAAAAAGLPPPPRKRGRPTGSKNKPRPHSGGGAAGRSGHSTPDTLNGGGAVGGGEPLLGAAFGGGAADGYVAHDGGATLEQLTLHGEGAHADAHQHFEMLLQSGLAPQLPHQQQQHSLLHHPNDGHRGHEHHGQQPLDDNCGGNGSGGMFSPGSGEDLALPDDEVAAESRGGAHNDHDEHDEQPMDDASRAEAHRVALDAASRHATAHHQALMQQGREGLPHPGALIGAPHHSGPGSALMPSVSQLEESTHDQNPGDVEISVDEVDVDIM